jgi:hypothetical protein
LDRLLDSKRSGDKLRILIARRSRIQEVEVILGKKSERSFRVRVSSNPDPLQKAILANWLRNE